MTSYTTKDGLVHSVLLTLLILRRLKRPYPTIFTRKLGATIKWQALHERCQMELPENFPAPRGDAAREDLQMHLRLVEELNRRKAIGERMYPSTRTVGMGLLSREGLELEFPQSMIIIYIHISSLGHISGSLAIFQRDIY